MKKKKKVTLRPVALYVVCVLLVVAAAVYIGFGIFFQKHFCFGTTIDGIDVGGKTVDEVKNLIMEEVEQYHLTVKERGDAVETVSGTDIGIYPVFNGELEQMLEDQNGFAWAAALVKHPALELETAVSYDETMFSDTVAKLSCMQAANQIAPVDASVSDYTGSGYELVPAEYGTTLDADAVAETIRNAVLVLAEETDLDEEGCYVKPEVEDDNATLLAAIDELNKYVKTKITYDFDVTKEVLDSSTISGWLSVDDDFQVQVDEEGIRAYVKELAGKYNTCYKPKTLKTSYGSTVTISNGPYGWKINNGEEAAKILSEIKEGKEVEREPEYSQRANSHGENDYGNSYVEINLTAQHLFLYKDGNLVTESDLVSGNVAKNHTTPGGAYQLTYKTMNAVLRGPDYETPVTYWMPFNGDIGMHDLTSRKAFGGDIYKKNGSHGCINLPFAAAKKIYETIDKGYCVLVYNLPGTESSAVKQKEIAEVVNAINAIGTVTLESEPAITNARTLYNALSDDMKASVTNYQTLSDAEAALNALKSGAVQTPADQGATQDPSTSGTSDQTPVEMPVQQPQVQSSDNGNGQAEQ